jgi:hypothetical protein
MTVSLLFGLAKLQSVYFSSALAGGSLSPLESVDPSLFSCRVPAYMVELLLYWPVMVVPAKCSRSTQILVLYSNVGAQLKVTEIGQSIILQPGIT